MVLKTAAIIITHQPQNSLLQLFWNFIGFKTEIFRKIPPLEANIQPGDSLLCNLSVLNFCSNVTQYIPHVVNVSGAPGMDFQEDPFHGIRDSENRVRCCWRKVSIITDGSQQTCVVKAKTCGVRNVNFQKYPSNRNQDTQNKLHSFPSKLALIINICKMRNTNFQQNPCN